MIYGDFPDDYYMIRGYYAVDLSYLVDVVVAEQPLGQDYYFESYFRLDLNGDCQF